MMNDYEFARITFSERLSFVNWLLRGTVRFIQGKNQRTLQPLKLLQSRQQYSQ